jgi:hypothetical protein
MHDVVSWSWHGNARCMGMALKSFSPDYRTLIAAVRVSFHRSYTHELGGRLLSSLHKDMK